MTLPIVPWIGGKRRLANTILPMFPPHKCYVEGFAGAAAIYFMKPQSDVEVINDINGDVVNLYRVVKSHLEEFVRQFKWCISSRQIYEWHQATPPDTLTDIQRAAQFYYLQKQAFGGKVDGQSYGTATTTPPRLNLLRIEEELSAAHLRLARTYVENMPWDRILEKYDRPHTLFYLDPPYWETEGYGVDFDWPQYERLADLVRSMEGMAIVSINDHPDIRRLFDGMEMQTTTIDYTVALESRPAQELIIRNDNATKKGGRQGDLFT